MRVKQIFAAEFCLIAAICFGLWQPLRAQAPADDKCEGSTVDIQGPKTAKAARAFLADLQAAVKANDKDKIAGMVSYPLNFIHDGKRVRIRSKQSFLAHYDTIFDEHVRSTILKQSSHCLFGNYQGEMIGNGEVWFSEMEGGLVKIITVNPSAGM